MAEGPDERAGDTEADGGHGGTVGKTTFTLGNN